MRYTSKYNRLYAGDISGWDSDWIVDKNGIMHLHDNEEISTINLPADYVSEELVVKENFA
jgi:hypothetical protein